MARNVEIKARVPNLLEVRARLAQLPSHAAFQLHQTDTFFRVAHGRLKLREFGDGTAELIFYERPDQTTAKLSHYDRIPCPDPRAMLHALGTALGIRGVVRKHRQVLLIGNTRVHLDHVECLGDFLELEVVLQDDESVASGEAIAAELLRTLNIPQTTLIKGAYIDLLEHPAPVSDYS